MQTGHIGEELKEVREKSYSLISLYPMGRGAKDYSVICHYNGGILHRLRRWKASWGAGWNTVRENAGHPYREDFSRKLGFSP